MSLTGQRKCHYIVPKRSLTYGVHADAILFEEFSLAFRVVGIVRAAVSDQDANFGGGGAGSGAGKDFRPNVRQAEVRVGRSTVVVSHAVDADGQSVDVLVLVQ